MANTNAPRGFEPVRNTDGTSPTVNKYSTYTIASTYGTAIGQFDPVAASGTADTNGRMDIVIGTATNFKVGVFNGVRWIDSTGKPRASNYWTASTVGTNIIADVHDDPNTIFRAQVDDTAGLVAADVGNGADVIMGTPNSRTGISGAMVDQSTLGQDNVLIVGLSQIPNNAFGQYAKADILWKEHKYAGPRNIG